MFHVKPTFVPATAGYMTQHVSLARYYIFIRIAELVMRFRKQSYDSHRIFVRVEPLCLLSDLENVSPLLGAELLDNMDIRKGRTITLQLSYRFVDLLIN